MAKHQITIKTGTDYDSTWHHFEGESGEEIQEALVEFYGLDVPEGGETPFETSLRAEIVAQAVSGVAHGLGGRVVKEGEKDSEDPWDRTPGGRPSKEDPNAIALETIEATESVAALREYFADNAALLQGSEELMAAWKAKGKALTEAEKPASD